VAQATKARIHRTALELFAAKGFHGTGVAEIGDRAGVQRGALYFHIGSKEELLWEVIRPNFTEILDMAESIAASDQPPLQKLRGMVKSHILIVTERQLELAVYARDRSALTGERRTEIESMRRRGQDAWERVFEEAAVAGVVRSADHVLVNGIVGLINMMYEWYRSDGADSPEQIADKLCGLVLDGIAVHKKSR
jgi:TetR/AcrR family transcriptional regulator, cholesterol catabolism regulator